MRPGSRNGQCQRDGSWLVNSWIRVVAVDDE
jgi:hypothetical protein